ncbi:MAG: hypothetical protein IJV45_01515, partial [Prevotella sp.]|nr:hypothetical protein [Prevotella sp.]
MLEREVGSGRIAWRVAMLQVVVFTGNELVNQLIRNTVWGQRSNYLSVPTDCPQRNERLGWTADTQV